METGYVRRDMGASQRNGGDSYRGWENPATPARMSISSLGIKIDARLCAKGAGPRGPGRLGPRCAWAADRGPRGRPSNVLIASLGSTLWHFWLLQGFEPG